MKQITKKKVKTKSKTTRTKKSVTKKSKTKKPIKKVSNRRMDRQSIQRKCLQNMRNLVSGVECILENDKVLQSFILTNMFWDCIYTTSSTSFFEKLNEEMEKDDDYRHEINDKQLYHQLYPMVKGRLQEAMRDLVDSGGLAKFQRVLDDINNSLEEERY